ncbi:MAG: ATP-dependent protease subunit HslV [Deltaproteobacteria bacterium]|nr:ATP-dependent protease subunit HslV [Deltaproteobacteria bacterium]
MFEGTTILAVKKGNAVALGGDGQVSAGPVAIKHTAVKIRKLYQDQVLAGFAGSTADALTLFEKFEEKLEEYRGNLMRAAVELAKEWRTDRMLRRLAAQILVCDRSQILMVSGNGDVLAPDNGVMAIGSGGPYARAAARALAGHSTLSAREIVNAAMEIAAEICVYTNRSIVIEELL